LRTADSKSTKTRSAEHASLLTVAIQQENDVVQARKRARQIAGLLGFDTQDQVRIATAVSELARNTYQYAGRGKIEFNVRAGDSPGLEMRLTDSGPGISNVQQILDGQYTSRTGMGMGILGARRLMDFFEIESSPGAGTSIVMRREFPKTSRLPSPKTLAELSAQLAREAPYDPFAELQQQNQELLRTLDELEQRSEDLERLNRELEDTNRGVVALYAELDEKAESLRRVSDLKTHFLSNMTHEFRTPLNSILSLARMLLDGVDGPLGVEQQRQVRFIKDAGESLSDLVNDLLDLAKVEAGKVVIKPAEFTVDDLFGALRGLLRPLLPAGGSVNLVFDHDETIPPLFSDEGKVSVILRNFVSNALKYTERGEVRVSARLEAENRVTFSVHDTGIGIAPEDRERIFEEYTQVEGEHQRGKRGTGLGLPLSKRLAALLGGCIRLESSPGHGSTFSLTLPLAYSGATEVHYALEAASDLEPGRIPVLIVEDNAETLFMYEKFLAGSDFQVVPVRSVQGATHALERFRPVAIILDILLQNENTWDLLSRVKSDPATREIPVFVVTMVENERKARSLGADEFMPKPLNRGWLLQRLAQLGLQRPIPEVLIVDDDEPSRYVLKSLLSALPLRVTEAAGGSEGLEMARKNRPSAIFLDLSMPDLHGREVLEQLKADPSTRDIAVIIYTATAMGKKDRRTLAASAVAIIPKSDGNHEQSLELIRRALAQAGITQPQPQPQAA
jgi:signal transduction histidine kinase/CheY-like chemotaxis protein